MIARQRNIKETAATAAEVEEEDAAPLHEVAAVEVQVLVHQGNMTIHGLRRNLSNRSKVSSVRDSRLCEPEHFLSGNTQADSFIMQCRYECCFHV